ncbi:MAG: thiamine pyrophosphate-binding protein, partial [Alphaproteobacteria bacterium]|nr:thiamine pyrophosphate-binding protein [Alphaproteobacteria bacterium]
MKRRGADVVVKALEDEGVSFTFGIPGIHNIELYDALERSPTISPVLVTDEQAASFMADAVSRSSAGVGVLNVVPGAGVSHAISGIAEAFMDTVPLVVLAAGIRDDTGRAYQLHAIDQMAMLEPVTKAVFKIEAPGELYSTVRRAFEIARDGAPGPVAVEIPANYFLLTQNIPELTYEGGGDDAPVPTDSALQEAARLLNAAKQPAIYAGYGAASAGPALAAVAERLGAPVTTTIQGKGVLAEDHALWLWPGFGRQAPPFVRSIMGRADVLLAIGCRFGEVATASYGLEMPGKLIHVDIEPEVFNKNYPADLAIEADAGAFLEALLGCLGEARESASLKTEIAAGHQALAATRAKQQSQRVSPAALFAALEAAAPQALYTSDSGNGTFLAMEHLRFDAPGRLLAPVDYSCMGYAVPAAIGAKFANPERDVIALAGDGALLMTGLELLTAAASGVAPLVLVLRDGELAQISQFQRITLNSDTCSVLPDYSVEAFAAA